MKERKIQAKANARKRRRSKKQGSDNEVDAQTLPRKSRAIRRTNNR